jgi:O-antigen ligase
MKDKWLNLFSRSLEYTLYALVFFIPVSIGFIEAFFTIAITLFTIKKIIEKDYRFLFNRTHLFLALFFVFSGLSLINSGIYFDRGVKALISKWLEYFLLFIIVADTLKVYRIRRNCVFILLGLSFFVGIDAFFQHFFGWEFFRQRKMIKIAEGFSGVTGPFTHYNNFGAYLVLILSLAFSQLVHAEKKIKKIFFSVLVVFLAASLLMTFSRGAWLGMGVAFVLMMLFLRRFKIPLAFVCIFLLILLVVPDIRERLLFTFQKGGDATRFMLWRGAWAMIKESPFLGKGLGTFMIYMPKYTHQGTIQYAHNSFLQIWAEAGIFSLLSFLIFLTLVLLKAMRSIKSNRDSILLGAFCGVCGFLAHGFFDSHLYSLQLAVLFWLMLGSLSASSSQPGLKINKAPQYCAGNHNSS